MENKMLSKLNCTEDALELGKNATEEELEMLAELRDMCGKEVKRLTEVASKTNDDNAWDAAILMGSKCQFCREAIEASKLTQEVK